MTIVPRCVSKLRIDEVIETHPFAVGVAALGLVAGVVCAVPAVAMFGLLLFVVPGILLGLAPTMFLYVVAWWALHVAAKAALGGCGLDPRSRLARWTAGIASGAAVVCLGVWIPDAASRRVEPIRAALTAPDFDLKDAVRVPRVVAVETLQHTDGRCGTICQRLLLNGAADKVIVPGRLRGDGEARAYFLQRGSGCSKTLLSSTDVAFPADRLDETHRSGEFRAWARIDAGECFAFEPAAMADAGLTIRLRRVLRYGRLQHPWTAPHNAIEAERLELLDGDGRALFRRTEVRAHELFSPLMINVASSPLSSVSLVGWARDLVTTAELDMEGRKVLPSLLGDALRLPDMPADQPAGAPR